MRRLALSLVLLSGCRTQAPERLSALFDSAHSDVQAGELVRAENECDRGIALARERHDTRWSWRFRLLRAEALLDNGRAEEVLSPLTESMPAGAEYAPLAARQKMLAGWAHSVLGHRED